MRRFRSIISFITLTCVVLIFSCKQDKQKKVPDISGVKITLDIKRFDQELFKIDTNALESEIQRLNGQFPEFFPLFAGSIIRDVRNPDETPAQAVRAFVTDPHIRKLHDTVQIAYRDLAWLEKDLQQMLSFYQYYFPKKPTPKVVTMISEFGTDAFTYGDSLCGIGLDMFMGENFVGYDPEFFPQFLRRQFEKPYITVRLAKAIAKNIVETGAPPGERLLDIMVENGKTLYLTDCLLPYTPDSLKMGYTATQMQGCYYNEQEAWARLLSEKLLYSTDNAKVRKLVTPSPNAPVLFEEAPGEVGNWFGWQIVRSFVAKNPQISLEEMLNIKDSQKFLEMAKYKPKSKK